MDIIKNMSKYKKLTKIILMLFLIAILLLVCPIMTGCGKNKEATNPTQQEQPLPPEEGGH